MDEKIDIKKLEAIYKVIKQELINHNEFQKNSIEYYELAIEKCRLALLEMKSRVAGYFFKDISDEIYFFKTLKPGVNSYLLYYLEIHQIETLWFDSKNIYLEKINEKINEISDFFQHHHEFYRCYKGRLHYMDEIYFTRGIKDFYWLKNDPSHVIEPEFSSGGDFLLSKILAYERMEKYLHVQTQRLTLGEDTSDKLYHESNKQDLSWTESKVALVELIYALYYSKAINMGNIEIKQLETVFEQIFDVELNDIYHTYTEIRNRKKDRIKFLDLLRNTLIRKMDELDGID